MPIALFLCLICAFYTCRYGDSSTLYLCYNYLTCKYNYIQPVLVDWLNMAKPAYQYKKIFFAMIPVETMKPLFVYGYFLGIEFMSAEEKVLFIHDYILPNTKLASETFVFIDKSGYFGLDLNLVKYGGQRYCSTFGAADPYYPIAQRLASIFVFDWEQHIVRPILLEYVKQGQPLDPDFSKYNEVLATRRLF